MPDRLIDINLDLFEAGGLMCLRHTSLQRLLWPAVRRFALVAQEFDQLVGKHGLGQRSSVLAHRLAAGTQISGGDRATGPAVILANHPGMTDTVALLAGLASRPDLRVIGLDQPFLRALPNVARHLIPVPDHELGRMGVVRAGVTHLSQGNALLTFPAGEIEPDSATFGRRKAVDSLLRWSDIFVLFARQVPQTRFIPALVSHVVSPQAQRHVLTLLRRTAYDEKQRLVAVVQVALPRYQKMVARVAFGPGQQASTCAAELLQAAIVTGIRHLSGASAGTAEAGAAREGAGHSAQMQHDALALLHRPLNP